MVFKTNGAVHSEDHSFVSGQNVSCYPERYVHIKNLKIKEANRKFGLVPDDVVLRLGKYDRL